MRFVPEQRLHYMSDNSQQEDGIRVYNLRKINELPFHLLRAQLLGDLKSFTLMNLEWMSSKLIGTSLNAMLDEYTAAIKVTAVVCLTCFPETSSIAEELWKLSIYT